MKERIIRFRAWVNDITFLRNWNSNITKKMFDVKSIDFIEKTITILNPNKARSNFIMSIEDVKLIQFTGLKDKKGKDIYEGDILKQGEGEHETLIEVRFGDGTFDSETYHFTGFYGVYLKIGFGGGFKKGDLCEDMDEITKNECDRREVIGNIYENPELLEEK